MVSEANSPRKWSFIVILFIAINSIVGTGIFFLPAVGAREAGLFAIVSWAIMGLIAIYYSTIFGELVSRYPKEGGVYEYAKAAFGFFPSFILGWVTIISANITIAMLMVGAIKYVGPALSNLVVIGISVFFILAFNLMAFKGMKTSKVMLLTFSGFTLLAILGILIPGLINFNPANFTGWLSHTSFVGLNLSAGGVFGGLVIIFGTIFFIAETFFGWETATFLAEEVENPKRVMPRALVRGTIIISVLSLLFVIASKSILHWSVLATSEAPLTALATAVYGSAAGPFYSILVYLAIIGSVAGWIVASPNLLVALAKDKLFVSHFADKHKKNNTPYKAIIFQAIVTSAIVVVGAGNYEKLLHLLVPMVLVLYASVVLSLIFIRKKHPSFDGYKAPGGKIGPWFLISFSVVLLLMWARNATNALEVIGIIGSFIILGIPVYLLMNFYHNPKASITFQNKTLELSKILERLFLPRRIRRKLLERIEPHHKVLFLGAGSGLLVKEIPFSEENIIIVEHSEKLVAYLQKRFPKSEVLFDEHLISRTHPEIKEAHVVLSIGMLSLLRDLPDYLRQIKTLVPENATIRFFEYIDLYKFIPNNDLLKDLPALKQIFSENGFQVKIDKVKGLLWNYLIIEGIRTDEDIAYF